MCCACKARKAYILIRQANVIAVLCNACYQLLGESAPHGTPIPRKSAQ